MNGKQLLSSLKNQDANLSLLMDSLELQKQAIINNDYASLEDAIGKEQIILHNIEIEESTRVRVVRDIAQNLNLDLRENTLEDIISKGGKHFEAEIKELVAHRKSLKEKIEQIRSTNTQLKDVIEFSRNIIKETMMMIAGPSKRALVNKRV